MYEMEGASRSRGSNGPIARARESAEPATIARRGLGGLRSTRCPPPRKAPSGVARRLVDPVANSGLRVLALANSRFLVLADSEVSPGAGSPSLVACEISIAAEGPAQEAVGTYFKILCDGLAHPQKQLRYPQSDARCPRVVHRFIHTRTQMRYGTTVWRRDAMAEATGPTDPPLTPRSGQIASGAAAVGGDQPQAARLG
jgi:hypothetical protein